ncbi:GPP34 family phosphoprotein [Clostridium sp. B9]|uniref:GPP34 family phosphoprotein n=1 Tax=Clostridium sp. B9 TaxID=3423224 RepID=UPI003D2EA18B
MRIKNIELSLSEQFVILDILSKKISKNKKVKLLNGKIYSIASIFIELFSDCKISFDEKQNVIFLETELTGVEFKDIILQTIISKKPMTLKEWIEYFYAHNKLSTHIYNSIIENLINKRVLELTSTNAFLASSKKIYVDSKKICNSIIEKIKSEILEDCNMDETTLHLTFLLSSNKILDLYFSEYEYNSINNRISKIYENNCYEELNIIKKSISDTNMFPMVTLVRNIVTKVV